METSYESAPVVTSQRSRPGEFFNSLPDEALQDFESLESLYCVNAGTNLFVEEQNPSDVLILLKGQVKLTINSSDGKRLILRIANPGEFLGLTSAFTGCPYTTTAETLYPCAIASVRRSDFLEFLCCHPGAYPSVARDLSLDCNQARSRLRTIALASSARAKFARLLLEWCTDGWQTERGIRLHLSLTHGEIGEFIGASRETVTRILGAFKHRNLVVFHGAMLTIPDRAALEQAASRARSRPAFSAARKLIQKTAARSRASPPVSRESRRILPVHGVSSVESSVKEKEVLRAEVAELRPPVEESGYFEESRRRRAV